MCISRKYKCPLCPFVAPTPAGLDIHVTSHTKEKPYKCPHCAFYATSNERSLKCHILRLHSGPAEAQALRKYKCEQCNFSTEFPVQLREHTRRHTGERPFLCPEDGCGKAYATKKTLKFHIMVHRDERPFQCEVPGCEYRARTKRMLKEHWAVHDNERPFKCPVPECNYSAKLQSSLYKHGRVHQEPKYACSYPGCDYRARYKANVRDHETIHSDSRPFHCPFPGCSYSAKTLSMLHMHNKMHTGLGNPHRCTFPGCSRRFQNRFHLNEHERLHRGEEPYSCSFPECGHKTWTKSSLQSHWKLHKPDKLPCTFSGCTYVAKDRHRLREHTKSHEDPAYASCPLCGCNYRSKVPTRLERHVKAHHSKRKNYPCPLCPRSYKLQSELEAHLQAHNGEKPYKCPYCNFRSVRVAGITGHSKRKHGKELCTRDLMGHRIKMGLKNPTPSDPGCLQRADKVFNVTNIPTVHSSTRKILQPKEINTDHFSIVRVQDAAKFQPILADCFVSLVRIKILF